MAELNGGFFSFVSASSKNEPGKHFMTEILLWPAPVQRCSMSSSPNELINLNPNWALVNAGNSLVNHDW